MNKAPVYKFVNRTAESIDIFVDGDPIWYLCGKNQTIKLNGNVLQFSVGTTGLGLSILKAKKIELKVKEEVILSSDILDIKFNISDRTQLDYVITLDINKENK